MTVYALDPLRDPRWPEFVGRDPNASVFHASGWLRALQRVYHYEPMAFTTSPPTAELTNGLLFCGVHSWLTGRRLVSVPFSDHCEPLVQSSEELRRLSLFVQRSREQRRWKYVEIRSASTTSPLEGEFQRTKTYYLHRLDLRPSLETLLRRFHKDCVQRKVRRAEREGLTYEASRSESLLLQLYGLLQVTRRRHQLPAQPLEWFRTLVDCLGDNACIRIAAKNGQPVAGILTLSHGKRMVYKYGGSDARLNNLGGMALLFWKAIQDAKQAGVEELDLGRSDRDNPGLTAFKEHWAAERSTLTYWRCPGMKRALTDGWRIHFAKQIAARLPSGALTMAGRLLYRHIGRGAGWKPTSSKRLTSCACCPRTRRNISLSACARTSGQTCSNACWRPSTPKRRADDSRIRSWSRTTITDDRANRWCRTSRRCRTFPSRTVWSRGRISRGLATRPSRTRRATFWRSSTMTSFPAGAGWSCCSRPVTNTTG